MKDIFYSAKLVNKDKSYTEVCGVIGTDVSGRSVYIEAKRKIEENAIENKIKFDKVIIISLNEI